MLGHSLARARIGPINLWFTIWPFHKNEAHRNYRIIKQLFILRKTSLMKPIDLLKMYYLNAWFNTYQQSCLKIDQNSRIFVVVCEGCRLKGSIYVHPGSTKWIPATNRIKLAYIITVDYPTSRCWHANTWWRHCRACITVTDCRRPDSDSEERQVLNERSA